MSVQAINQPKTTESALKPRHNSGIFAGFGNLFQKEMGDWWKSKRWIVTFLVFLVTIGGLMLVLSSAEELLEMERTAMIEAGASAEELASMASQVPGQDELVMMYFLMGSVVMLITAVVIVQDAVISERQMGTAQWLISKPMSRTSFILSKFAAHTIGLTVTGVLAVGGIVYLLLHFWAGVSLNFLSFAAGSGVMLLMILFFLTLTLMLGTFSDNRALVAGLPIGLALMAQSINGLAPFLADYLPYALVFPAGSNTQTVAAMLATQTPVVSWTPVYATIIWIIIFLGMALWRFHQEEF